LEEELAILKIIHDEDDHGHDHSQTPSRSATKDP
jgi:hypothetical protein